MNKKIYLDSQNIRTRHILKFTRINKTRDLEVRASDPTFMRQSWNKYLLLHGMY